MDSWARRYEAMATMVTARGEREREREREREMV